MGACGMGLGIVGVAQGTFAAEAIGAMIGLFLITILLGYHPPRRFRTLFSFEAFKTLTVINFDIMVRSFVLLAAFACSRASAQALERIN